MSNSVLEKTQLLFTKSSDFFSSAIIVAAGNSTRMMLGLNSKQFIDLAGKPAISYTLDAFQKTDSINEIIVVARESDINTIFEIAKEYKIDKLYDVVPGGSNRQQSVLNGINACSKNTDFYVIHDGARPLVTKEIISDTLKMAINNGACASAVRVKDSIKTVNEDNMITSTVNRSNLWCMHTPQIFKKDIYLDSINKAEDYIDICTDDCQIVEKAGYKVYICEGSYENIKITTPEDVIVANAIIEKRGKNLCE